MTTTETAEYARDGNVGTLKLDGCVDINVCATVHAAACHALKDSDAETICLEMSRVERLDIATLQILCALARDVSAGGRTFQVAGLSAELSAEIAQVGISL